MGVRNNMTWDFITKITSGLNSIGLIVFVLLAWKMGLLQWLADIKKSNGNGNGKLQEYINQQQATLNSEFKQAIVDLTKHAQVANDEVGYIKNDIALIKDLLMKK